MDSLQLPKSSDYPLIQTCLCSEYHLQDNIKPPDLETILSGLSLAPYSRIAFMEFLKKFHCAENLEFLLNSNQYLQHIKLVDVTDYLLQERRQLWNYIYNTFISEDSPKELNIPHDIKIKFKNCNELPPVELIELTNCSIKDLLRDVYLQFLQHVRTIIEHRHRPKHLHCDKINEHYSLLSTPTEEYITPRSTLKTTFRRLSDNYSPLDPPSASSFFNMTTPLPTPRCSSPSSSGFEIEITKTKSHTLSIPKCSTVHFSGDFSEELTKCSKEKKKSVSEQSGLKKFAEKLKWRRLSSNSTTISN